jgi:hypothetical protein
VQVRIIFYCFDKNGDGALSAAELKEMLLAVNAGSAGGGQSGFQDWELEVAVGKVRGGAAAGGGAGALAWAAACCQHGRLRVGAGRAPRRSWAPKAAGQLTLAVSTPAPAPLPFQIMGDYQKHIGPGGLTLEGVGKAYEDGAGDIDADFQAIWKECRLWDE